MSRTYAQRAKNFPQNEVARMLLKIIEQKRTNLCVAIDLTKKRQVLEVIEKVGPYVCLIKEERTNSKDSSGSIKGKLRFSKAKTHIDIIEDFDQGLIDELRILQERFNFLIFEDRKFADIGNTVKLQYSSGIYKIAEWAHITNAHPIPGDGIIKGLKEVGKPLGRSLLILSEMSSAGSLATGSYTEAAIEMARRHRDFVIGFVAGRKLTGNNYDSKNQADNDVIDNDDFIVMSPGVGLSDAGDKLGQQYRSPRDVVLKSGSDVIIVGRGIYGEGRDIIEEAKRYQESGWNAYLERLELQSNK
ncbi:10919_t:CDS:2 [Ambispora gerdemannii]|uniref:Orotidine 5'-phosphate decarboxylase n=1 Tax=Ambispora gerdemannii TaxID=144530 RepID=A0A9N9CI79_9GLOM|nr:10919_t:CDS:2 [Ambispora gerdemannii]